MAARIGGVAVALAQGALALADQSLLVPLHPLQLLLGTHPPPQLRLSRLPGVQALQGTLWSLLRQEAGGGRGMGWEGDGEGGGGGGGNG